MAFLSGALQMYLNGCKELNTNPSAMLAVSGMKRLFMHQQCKKNELIEGIDIAPDSLLG